MIPKSALTWNHTFIQKILQSVLIAAHRLVRGIANRVLDKNFTNPRQYSNAMMRYYAPLFSGDVINVSGASDSDYYGSFYKDYFKTIDSYSISNAPTADKGLGSVSDKSVTEIEIDLNKPVIDTLQKKYDVVLNHTTLEHVYEMHTAFKNLCDMSRDAVIIVVPVLQQIHIRESFGDYNRPTTMGIAKMFKENGFTPLVVLTNNQPFAAVYCFAIGVRDPKKYADIIEPVLNYKMGDYLYGGKLDPQMVERVIDQSTSARKSGVTSV